MFLAATAQIIAALINDIGSYGRVRRIVRIVQRFNGMIGEAQAFD